MSLNQVKEDHTTDRKEPGIFKYNIKKIGKTAIILKIFNDITMDVNDQFNEVLLNLTEKGKHIILDLASVDFISSTGFGVIANCNGKLKEDGMELIILSPTDNVQRVFEILDFKQILPILDTPQALTDYLNT